MLNLQALQISFQDFLLKKNTCIANEIQKIEPVSIETRLGVYHDAYYLRLQEVLEQDYQVLRACMGDDLFHQLTRDYIDAYPSVYRSIRWYGKNLAKWMYATNKDVAQEYLIEMAEFEWLLTESFDAPDSVPIDMADMAVIPPEKWPDLMFQLQPAMRKFDLNWNTVPLWKSYKNQGEFVVPEKNEAAIPHLIWRKNYHVQFSSLSTDSALVLDMIENEANFSSICEGLCAWVDEVSVAMHAASLLKQFIFDGLIVGIDF